MSNDNRDGFPTGPSDEEIAERLQRVRQEIESMRDVPDLAEPTLPSAVPLPPVPAPDEFEERIAAVQARAARVNSERTAKKQQDAKRAASEGEASRGLGIGMSVAYTILGFPLVGIAIGWAADSGTDSNVFRGIGALVGSIVGIVAAIYLLNRYQNPSK